MSGRRPQRGGGSHHNGFRDHTSRQHSGMAQQHHDQFGHQYHDQYGHPWPLQHHHHHQQEHPHPLPQHYSQQQNQSHQRNTYHQHQHQHQHHERQHQQVQPVLYTTGGRPWTMYRRAMSPKKEKKKRGRCSDGPDTPEGAVAGGGGGGGAAAAATGGRAENQRGRRTHITVVSYNVLADSLVSFDYIPYCKTWNEAAWRARPGRVLQKVLEFRPTVVCLQEVDENQYESLFKMELGSLGYVGAYCKRSGGKSDGCATFVLGNEVRLVEQEDVAYKLQGHPVLDRDNVALLVVVDVLSRSQSPASIGDGATAEPSAAGGRGAAARLVIANTHLVFNPKRGDVKTAQLMLLTGKVERLAKSSRADGVMICGDFNMTPDSALYHYMVKGSLAVDGLNRFSVSGQCGPNYSQRQETDNSGTLSSRGPGVKHQGSGCSLGSFLRPPNPAGASRGGRGGGGRGGNVRGRGGRGMRGRTPGGPSCQACSNRLPHEASSTYVIADDTASPASKDYRCPPGAPPGTHFAVVDPLSCRCVTSAAVGASGGHGGNGSCREEGVVGKRKSGSAAGGSGDEVPQRTREPYEPPVLWPVNGDKFAYRRDRGPVAHGLRLESAYAQQGDAWGTGEPAFTSYHHMFKGTVDYIFYGPGVFSQEELCTGSRQEGNGMSASAANPDPLAGEVSPRTEDGERRGCLRCVGVAEPPLRRDLDRFGGLPSPEEPSDHILLAARFEVTLRF